MRQSSASNGASGNSEAASSAPTNQSLKAAEWSPRHKVAADGGSAGPSGAGIDGWTSSGPLSTFSGIGLGRPALLKAERANHRCAPAVKEHSPGNAFSLSTTRDDFHFMWRLSSTLSE